MGRVYGKERRAAGTAWQPAQVMPYTLLDTGDPTSHMHPFNAEQSTPGMLSICILTHLSVGRVMTNLVAPKLNIRAPPLLFMSSERRQGVGGYCFLRLEYCPIHDRKVTFDARQHESFVSAGHSWTLDSTIEPFCLLCRTSVAAVERQHADQETEVGGNVTGVIS